MLAKMRSSSVHAVVTDPPYELAFMNHAWDGYGTAYDVSLWREVLRVLKPGGHLLAFGAPRTYHRLACAIEDAGFEIRDSLHWIQSQGFPKGQNVSKAIDGYYGAERPIVGSQKLTGNAGVSCKEKGGTYAVGAGLVAEKTIDVTASATPEAKAWEGWNCALKPAHEPIIMARKPLSETSIAKNVLRHGTGAINVGACRVPGTSARWETPRGGIWRTDSEAKAELTPVEGRWPPNVLLSDGAAEIVDAQAGPSRSSKFQHKDASKHAGRIFGARKGAPTSTGYDDSGGVSRYFPVFYCPKASKSDRGEGNKHPTVKPTKLMEYLVTLVTPPNGIVLDPFMGSGTTGVACYRLGYGYIGIEVDASYAAIAINRIQACMNTSHGTRSEGTIDAYSGAE